MEPIDTSTINPLVLFQDKKNNLKKQQSIINTTMPTVAVNVIPTELTPIEISDSEEPQTRPHSASTIAKQERLDLLVHNHSNREIFATLLKPLMLSVSFGLFMSFIIWIMDKYIKLIDWKINEDGTTYYSENAGYQYMFYELPYYILMLPITIFFYNLLLTNTKFIINLVLCIGHTASIIYTSSITFNNRLRATSGSDVSCYSRTFLDMILLYGVNCLFYPIICTFINICLNNKDKKNYLCILGIILINEVTYVLFQQVFSVFYLATIYKIQTTKVIIRLAVMPFISVVGTMMLKQLTNRIKLNNECYDIVIFAQFMVLISVLNRYLSNIQDSYLSMTIYTLIGSFSDIFIRYLFPRIKKAVSLNVLNKSEKEYLKVNYNPIIISRNARIIVMGIIIDFTLAVILYLIYFIKQTNPLEIANNHLIYDVDRNGSNLIGKFDIGVISYGTVLSIVLECIGDFYLIKYQKKFNIPVFNAIQQYSNFIHIKKPLFWFLLNSILFATLVYMQTIIQSTAYFSAPNDIDACLVYNTCNGDICCNRTFITADGRNITNMFVTNDAMTAFCDLK